MSRSRGSTAGGRLQQRVDPARGQLGQRGPRPPLAVGAAVQQTVHLQPHREPVRGGARQPGALAQLGQPDRLGRGHAQHPHGFVEHADPAMLSHKPILTSYDLRRPEEQPWGRTMAEKVWDAHLVRKGENGEPDLLYIDLHLVHEVTSPQAFDGLRMAGRPVRRPDLTLATEDHNVPTLDVLAPIADEVSRTAGRDAAAQLRRVRRHALPDEPRRAGHRARRRPAARAHPAGHDGRLRRLAHLHPRRVRRHGVRHRHLRGRARAGHADVAAQAVQDDGDQRRRRRTGGCGPGVTSKDVVLAIIAKIGTGGGQGYVLEYRGNVIENLSMEARMTICNMSIEAGARAGMIAPDDTTFDYLRAATTRRADFDAAVAEWRELATDDDAVFDAEVHIDADALTPFVTWGTNPGQGLPLAERVPDPEQIVDENERVAAERALDLHGL